jgi:HSP20 family protein
MRNDLIDWEPLKKELMDVRDVFERIIPRIPRVHKTLLREGLWAPVVDIFEKNGNLIVHAELPGMEKKDIKVTVEGDILTIRGERRMEEEVKEKDYYFCERTFGTFSRSLTLPVAVDKNKVKASYKDGVLIIELPKTKEAKESEFEIQIQ